MAGIQEGRPWTRTGTEELERWLTPFLGVLDHETPRRMCPAYIASLIVRHDRLPPFIAAGVSPLEAALWQQADAMVGGADS